LTYLNFQCVRELSPTLGSAPPTVPLVEYASRYWGKHIRKEKTESTSPLALKLLIGFEHHISSHLLLLNCRNSGPWRDWVFDEWDGPNCFTGLHWAALLGVGRVVAALLGTRELDIKETDALGRTALVWVAIQDHKEGVKILLQRKDLNPNAPDTKYGGTPLPWAAEYGYDRIVRLLLEREDINPNTPDVAVIGHPSLGLRRVGIGE